MKQIEWAFLFFKLTQLNHHSATDETLNVMSNDMYAVEKAGRKNRSVACNTSSFPPPTHYSRDGKDNVTVPGTTASLNNNNSDVTLHNKSECHYSWSALCTEELPLSAAATSQRPLHRGGHALLT